MGTKQRDHWKLDLDELAIRLLRTLQMGTCEIETIPD